MKKLLLLVFIFVQTVTKAQEIKKTDYIVNSLTGLKMGVTTIKENGAIIRREYFAFSNTTNQFDDGMTLAQSNNEDDFVKQLENLKDLMTKLEKGEFVDISFKRTAKKDTSLGVKVLWISGDGQAGIAQLNEGQIDKLLDKFKKWKEKSSK
ncbi:hypothetical protein [Flavobacterium sp. FlaQc-28]|uniref:hypothetical protein n=1 Tax=Flavobacterium sp. FlaQc-28 TaxID=3374178 RepID=UPI0037578F71